jgi:hypothetical protein
MPLPANDAVSRRDDTLARTRRASRWITMAAIAAAVTLGSAFAHALPGHYATTAPGQAGSSGAHRPVQGARTSRHHHGASHQHKSRHQLQPSPQPPAQPPPTSTPTPPPVVSGGS